MAGLPDVPGPKLLPFDFEERRDDFELVKFLGKGIHAHVWRVKIKQKEYALKIVSILKEPVFKSFRLLTPEKFQFWLHDEPSYLKGLRVTRQESQGYFDPFACECRAYARLKECGLEEYAVKCHGYILLGRKLQQQLKEKDHHDWVKEWGWKKKWARKRLPALVKDLVDADFDALDNDDDLEYQDYLEQRVSMNLDRQSGIRLVRGIKLIHRNGIVVRDIHNGNIAQGKILDFSSAWTAPHPCFTPEILHANGRFHLPWYELSYMDGYELDKIVDKWNKHAGHKHKDGPIPNRVTMNDDYVEKLRPRDRWNEQRQGVRHRAEMYGWSVSDRKRWKELCGQHES